MQTALACFLGTVLFSLAADGPANNAERFGVSPDLVTYPQSTPKESLSSVLKAIDAGRYDYLVGQLAEPYWIDGRVRRLFGGRFVDQVNDTRTRLDPGRVKLLRRYLAEGEWTIDKDRATARLKDVADSAVFLVRHEERWYLEHRSQRGN
jgi:hypothetical protein